MSRLQRKCLAASFITHGLLLVIFLIGSAFVPHKPIPEPPAFEMIPLDALVVEGNVVGGGKPNVRLPEPKPQPPVQRPIVTPPPVEPVQETPPPVVKKPEPRPEPKQIEKPKPAEPVKPVTQPKPADDRFKLDQAKPKPKPKPPERVFDLSQARKAQISSPQDKNISNAQRDDASKSKEQLAALSAVTERIGRRLGDATNIDIPGPGGQAYVGYGHLLRKIYEDAWITPGAARDKEPIVEVEVVIAKSGKVLSSRIVKKSGNAALDRSVQDTLNRVKTAPPFPAGATDEKRTFRISFNLISKLG